MEKINVENITADEPIIKKSGDHTYAILSLAYEEKPLDLRIDGKMKIYEHPGQTFSLGLTIPTEKLEMFENIEKQIARVANAQKTSVKKLNHKFASFYSEDLSLIKTDASELQKIYSKLYTDKNGQINCPFFQLKNAQAKTKFNPHEIISIPFNGTLILRIKQVFLGNIKSITCVAREVLIKEIIKPKSYFDDYEEVEDEDNIEKP